MAGKDQQPAETRCVMCKRRIVTGEELCGQCKRGTDRLIEDIKKNDENSEGKGNK